MKTLTHQPVPKLLFFFIMICSILIPVSAQEADDYFDNENDIIKTQYTVLDEVSKSYRSFLGSRSGEIRFELIELKNLTTDELILGVEVNIQAQETEQTSSSIALGSVGSIWGVSSGATYRNLQQSGYIFLNGKDLETILEFLNDVIGATGIVQDAFTLYSISIRQQFEFGMMYDPESSEQNKWAFTFTVDNSTYSVDYQEGISMIRTLTRFRDYINEN